MGLNDILGTALSGLTAAQAGLKTVSNNIANVSTPGYARETIDLSAAVTAGTLNGVSVGETRRVADRFLENTVYTRAGDAGKAQATSEYVDQLQSLLGAPGAEGSIAARLDAIGTAAIGMTGTPISVQSKAAFVSNVSDAIAGLQQLQAGADTLQANVSTEIGSTVDQVNALLKRIDTLNGAVAQSQVLGRSTAGPADQRNSALQDLSTLVQVVVRPQADGRVTIESPGGAVLLDRRLRQLSYAATGETAAQPTYSAIEVRFASSTGDAGVATGDVLASGTVGGRLGGLMTLRDRTLPDLTARAQTLFGALGTQLNGVSASASTVPPPSSMTGHDTGLAASDLLRFSGKSTIAITNASGALMAKADLDFGLLGPGATVGDLVSAINGQLGAAGTASFTSGKLSISANGANRGVAIGDDPTTPATRGGQGLSQFFGMNDMVTSDGLIGGSGLTGADPAGFQAGQSAQLVLRDSTGRQLASATIVGDPAATMGDVLAGLNAGPLSVHGSFALQPSGRIAFTPLPDATGATISIPADSTDRLDTGMSFTTLSGLTGSAYGLTSGAVRGDIVADANRLSLARLDTTATVGRQALGAGDTRMATAFSDTLDAIADLGLAGTTTVTRFATAMIGKVAVEASQATASATDANARRDDAVNRRDSFSGVSIDDELAQMVVLQQSYSASARVLSTASEMYDTLLSMIR